MDTNTGVRFFLVLLYASILDEIQHSGPHKPCNRNIPRNRKMLLFEASHGMQERVGKCLMSHNLT
jgi:hypothetical protein